MSHRHRALSLLIAVVAVSVPMPAASAASVATVVTMNGPAVIEQDGTTVVGVTTGPDTTVVVAVDGTHEVTVYQNTQLRIGDDLGLRIGTVRVRGSLTVATASARSGVRDSEMTVAYDDASGITTVEVADREALVRGNNDDVEHRVPAGQSVRVGRDGITSAPRATSPEEITAARVGAPGADASPRNRRAYLVMAIALAALVTGLVGSRRSQKIPSPA